MANHYTGQEGTLYLEISSVSTAIGQLQNISVDYTVNTVESTVMGDSTKTFMAGLKEWTATATISYNPTDQGNINTAINSNAELGFIAYPGTAGAGDPKLSGNVIITGLSVSSSTDALVSGDISMQGTGDLTIGVA